MLWERLRFNLVVLLKVILADKILLPITDSILFFHFSEFLRSNTWFIQVIEISQIFWSACFICLRSHNARHERIRCLKHAFLFHDLLKPSGLSYIVRISTNVRIGTNLRNIIGHRGCPSIIASGQVFAHVSLISELGLISNFNDIDIWIHSKCFHIFGNLHLFWGISIHLRNIIGFISSIHIIIAVLPLIRIISWLAYRLEIFLLSVCRSFALVCSHAVWSNFVWTHVFWDIRE